MHLLWSKFHEIRKSTFVSFLRHKIHNKIYLKITGSKRLNWCWWRMLETECVGDRFKLLVTDLIRWNIPNITILSSTSKIGHQHQWNRFEPVDLDHIVNNITMSPTVGDQPHYNCSKLRSSVTQILCRSWGYISLSKSDWSENPFW